MAVNPISDTSAVLDAIRLGWAMAEVRARYWIALDTPFTRPDLPRDAPDANFLPLGRERTDHELAIQTQLVVCGLAGTLGLDLDCSELSWQADAPGKATDQLLRLIREVETTWDTAWPRFSAFLYAWDARIQDRLAAGSFTESAGYLLGRGLGEICWGPTMANPVGVRESPTTWSTFLGGARRGNILRYLDRLTGYFSPLTVPAIRCSLAAWAEVADDADWRAQPRVADQLNVQALLWRDLLLGQRDPESLIVSTWNLGKARSGWRVFRVFWPQVLTAAIGIVLLSGAAWILASPKSAVSHGLGAVLGVLGFFGITGAGLHARANNTAQQLLAKVRLTYELDLIADAATLRPAKVVVLRPGVHRRAPPLLRRRDLTSNPASITSAGEPAIVGDSQADVQVHQSRRETWQRPRLAGGP
jgi:hypothetical protein